MTPEELIKEVQDLTNEDFPKETWLRWFNHALADLTKVLFLETYEEFSVSDKERELPGDVYLIKLLILERPDGSEVELERGPIGSKGNYYWRWGKKVYFAEEKEGTLKLWYFRRPARLTFGSKKPDLPEEDYEDALILYAAAKSKAPDRWLTDKSDFYRDYLIRKQQIREERFEQMFENLDPRQKIDGWW